jgi:hypothetical protein
MSAPVNEAIDPLLAPPQKFSQDEPIEDRHVVGSEEQQEAAKGEPETTIVELTDAERSDFKNLMTVGRRVKSITVMDHSVVIQTLTVSDECRIGLYTKQYLDTQFYGRAHQVAVCAAGIRTVDTRPLYQPLGETEPDAFFDEKVVVLEKYYPIVISQIYNAIMELEREFADLALKLGKLGKPDNPGGQPKTNG